MANIFSFIDKLMIEIINKNIEIEMAEGNKKTPNLKIILSISLSFKKSSKKIISCNFNYYSSYFISDPFVK